MGDTKTQTELQYLRANLGMTGSEFMSEWKGLTESERKWYRDAARAEAASMGITLTTR